MKLPSIEHLFLEAARAVRRFPGVIVCAVTAATAANIMIDASPSEPWIRVIAAATLGLPLFVGLTFLAERQQWSVARAWMLRAAGFAVLLLFYWRWSGWGEAQQVHRYFHLSATFHLTAAAIAYIGVREPNGFWQFNRALFLRFLIGGVFSAALFAGLAIALAGIENLFSVDVDDDWYFRLWLVIALVFQTWFFVAGLPRSFATLETTMDYPAGLRVFAQYVLLPLVSVYLVILTAYLGRILITRTWPSGWIGYLVSALAALGILSLLLIHPERGRSEHRWIDRYARIFWVAILPSVVMLLLAIWQRVEQYGITERRYLLTILALWLAITAVYYAGSRSRGIKGIPLSLALVGLVAYLGPWSAYSVARASQVGRLERLFETNGVLVDGRVSVGPTELSGGDWRQTNEILSYLFEHHGSSAIDRWFDGQLATIDTIGNGLGPSLTRSEAGRRSHLVMSHLALTSADGLMPGAGEFTHYSSQYGEYAFPVAGFDYVLPNIAFGTNQEIQVADSLAVGVGFDGLGLDVRLNGRSRVRLPLDRVLDWAARGATSSTPGNYTFPRDSLRFEGEANGLRVRIFLQTLALSPGEPGPMIENATGTVMIQLLEVSGTGPSGN